MHWAIAHLIGDYLLQNDWMAGGKKQKTWIAAVHVIAYMLPFLLVGLEWWQLGAIALQHFLQDRTGFVVWFMNKKGQANFAKPPMAPWSIIVVDNVLHVVWIAAVVQSSVYV